MKRWQWLPIEISKVQLCLAQKIKNIKPSVPSTYKVFSSVAPISLAFPSPGGYIFIPIMSINFNDKFNFSNIENLRLLSKLCMAYSWTWPHEVHVFANHLIYPEINYYLGEMLHFWCKMYQSIAFDLPIWIRRNDALSHRMLRHVFCDFQDFPKW